MIEIINFTVVNCRNISFIDRAKYIPAIRQSLLYYINSDSYIINVFSFANIRIVFYQIDVFEPTIRFVYGKYVFWINSIINTVYIFIAEQTAHGFFIFWFNNTKWKSLTVICLHNRFFFNWKKYFFCHCRLRVILKIMNTL